MLRELRVSGLGVLDEFSLGLAPGLNVITGETGAGKSMLVRALGLLGGGRADSSMLRDDVTEAEVESSFDLTAPSRDVLVAAGIPCDDDEVVIARRIRRGGSRAYVNGRIAAASVLADLGGVLLETVGQHSARSLVNPAAQRRGLDRAGGDRLSKAAAATAEAYDRLEAVLEERRSLGDDPGARARELDMVTFQLDEIDAAAPRSGEDDELVTEVARLGNSEALQAGASEAHGLVAQARDLLGAAGAIISGIDDRACADASLAVEEAATGAEVAAADLRAFAESCEADPERLDVANRRLAELKGLGRKYGPTLADVIRYRDEAAERRAALVAAERRCTELDAEVEAARVDLERAAAALTRARREAAPRLAAGVVKRLGALAFADPVFEVRVTAAPAVGSHGADAVSYVFAAAPSLPTGPIERVASGGELSRLMLALATELADSDAAPTIVFDEIDAGTGGETAVAVGECLEGLAGSRQIVCVTHLAQIAAVADCHVRVARRDDGTATAQNVSGDERITELSRMLSGSPTSSRARRHAAELVKDRPSRRRRANG